MNAVGMPVEMPGSEACSNLEHQQILTELKALQDLVQRRLPGTSDAGADGVNESGLRLLKDETDTIHRAIARTKQEIASLHLSGFDINGRVARELDAVVSGSERATHTMLEAAEEIDQAANALSAMLKQEQQRGLAQDIQDHVIRIFEACNFQDLSGQRITKVLATLKFVDEHIKRMMDIWGGIDAFKEYAAGAQAERNSEPKLVNGPKLEGDSGHASQREVDKLFG